MGLFDGDVEIQTTRAQTHVVVTKQLGPGGYADDRTD